jgi:hypothetical protein
LTFVFLGFLMKIAEEFIHEMGHALFVWMLGGNVRGISISLVWPFRLSYTTWGMMNPSNIQLALIASAGILVETLASIAGQSILLLRKRMRPVYEISLFWLSFWAYLSTVVYLVIGAVYPFGDILDLINAVPVSRLWIGTAGVALLVSNTYSFSIILRDVFSRVLPRTRASETVSYFWVFLHTFFVLITVSKYGLPASPTIAAMVLLLMFIWSYLSVRWSLVIFSRLGGSREITDLSRWAKPTLADLPIENRVGRRKLKLGYVALFSFALTSALLTGYMINQYVATYRVIMETDIEVDVIYFELDQEPVMNLSVKVVNPTSDNLMLSRIEFDVHLNQKFMVHNVLRQIPVVNPESQITFNNALTLPLDRMFTVEEALKEGRWEWTISGSGYVKTLFGETLLRFKSASKLEPEAA